MNRLCWWWIDRLSRMLEPLEREAVRGDLAESDEPAHRALREIVGLVARRQAAFWRTWRPWVALLGVVLPIGYLLGLGALYLAGTIDLNVWIIRNYPEMDRALLQRTGYTLVLLAVRFSVAACRAWVVGYVLAHLSRRTIHVHAALLAVVMFSAEVLAGPRYRFYMAGVPYTTSLFGLVFPIILIAAVILPAALSGMRNGLRPIALPVGGMIPAAVVLADLIFPRVSPVAIVLNWPVLYMVATTCWRGRAEDSRPYLPPE